MKSKMIIAALVAGAAAPGTGRAAAAQPALDLDNAYITGVSASGSACPAGVPGVILAPDRSYFILIMPDNFRAAVGPRQPALDPNAFCTISLYLDTPPGWTFAIQRVHYLGYANLDPGVLGQLTLTHWFQGFAAMDALISTTLVGPRSGSYSGQKSPSELVYKPCGLERALNLDIDVAVSNSASPSRSGTMGAGPGTFAYFLTWRKC